MPKATTSLLAAGILQFIGSGKHEPSWNEQRVNDKRCKQTKKQRMTNKGVDKHPAEKKKVNELN